MSQRTQLVIALLAMILFSLLAAAAACGPNRDDPNPTGDPLMHGLGGVISIAA